MSKEQKNANQLPEIQDEAVLENISGGAAIDLGDLRLVSSKILRSSTMLLQHSHDPSRLSSSIRFIK